MEEEHEWLRVNIKYLKILCLWYDNNASKYHRILVNIGAICSILYMFIGIFIIGADFIMQILGEFEAIENVSENLTNLLPAFGGVYTVICFTQNRESMRQLLQDIKLLASYSGQQKMLDIEKKSSAFTKFVIFYGLFGNICYSLFAPLFSIDTCREERAKTVYSKDIPCELTARVRMPFKYENTTWVYIIEAYEVSGGVVITLPMITISMFIVSLVMQILTQLQNLQEIIRENKHSVRYLIKYHIAIIRFSTKTTEVFGSNLMLYITMSSLEISVLTFDIAVAKNFSNAAKYILHLLGWVIMLFVLCTYGQKLINESTKVAFEVYSIPWYDKSISDQKDLQLMIMRSQKPLILAASWGMMSLETYMTVISSAYSYFMLLAQVKEK